MRSLLVVALGAVALTSAGLSWEMIAAALAFGTGILGHLRAIGKWFQRLVVLTKRTDNYTAGLILSYLSRDRPPQGTEPTYVSVMHLYVRPLARTARVIYHCMRRSGAQMLRHGRALVWYRLEKADQFDMEYNSVFSFIRGTVDWEKLLADALLWELDVKRKQDKGATRFRVVYHHGKKFGGTSGDKTTQLGGTYYGWSATAGDRPIHWKPDEIGAPLAMNVDQLALMPTVAAAIDDARLWRRSETWFREHKMPWRRGYLFEGPPGTGKTTLAREIAAEFNFPIHVIDLASMCNEDLREAWGKIAADAPCIALIEDVDGVFRGRVPVTVGFGPTLSFDTLLNCIDGVERADGVITILSTNDASTIDPALKRAGRCDRQIQFVDLDHERRLKVAIQVLGDTPMAHKLAIGEPDQPAAKFSELCVRTAVELFFEGLPASSEPYR